MSDTTRRDPSWPAWVVGVLVAAVVVGTWSWSAADPHLTTLRPGDEVTADVRGSARTVSLPTPSGRVEATLTVADVADKERAPSGGHLVAVDVESKSDGYTTGVGGDRMPIQLVAGGRTHDVLQDSTSGSAALAVSGPLESLRVVLTLRGERQWAEPFGGGRDLGRFAPYQHPVTSPERTPEVHTWDPTGRPTEIWDGYVGTADVRRLPYLPGHGWAAPAQEWLLVDYTPYGSAPELLRAGESVAPSDTSWASTIVTANGAQPFVPSVGDAVPVGLDERVFRVRAGTPVRLVYGGTVRVGDEKTPRRATATVTLPGRAGASS